MNFHHPHLHHNDQQDEPPPKDDPLPIPPPPPHSSSFKFNAAASRLLSHSAALTPTEASMSSGERARLIQATRREIAAKVRDDWDWPTPPEFQIPPSRHPLDPPPNSESLPNPPDGPALRDPTSLAYDPATITTWAPRSLDSSPSPSPPPPELSPSSSQIPRTDYISPPPLQVLTSHTPALDPLISPFLHSPNYLEPPKSPYRFDSPDSIGPTLAQTERTRRTKRRKLVQDEQEYNPGLRCFIARRDAWCGAVTRHDSGDSPPNGTSSSSPNEAPPPSPTLLPLPPPLLPPTHPLHPPPGQLPPATYPQIYTKCVLKSLTPSVPINLRDLTTALVQGWKDDDLWPPRPTPIVAAPPPSVRRVRIPRGGDLDLRELEDGLPREARGGVRGFVGAVGGGVVKKVLGFNHGQKGRSGGHAAAVGGSANGNVAGTGHGNVMGGSPAVSQSSVGA